jgi:hypothetical protein
LQPQTGEDREQWMQGDELHANGLYIRKVRIRADPATGGVIRKIYQQRAWSTPSTLRLLTPEEETLIGRYLSLSSIWEALEKHDTVLIKGSWLIRWSKSGRSLPRRQDLPQEAIWDPKELKGLVEKFEVFLMALSYCWAASNHPDENGEQIKILTNLLEKRLAVRYHDCSAVSFDVGIFLDWCSLHQGVGGSLNTEEQSCRQRGLIDASLWYAHERIESWLLTKVPDGIMPYDSRGWPTFEKALASLITPDHMLLDIGQYNETDHAGWPHIYGACKAGRSPPITPEKFNKKMSDLGFSVPKDLELLQKMYTETFIEVLAGVQELAFSNLNWIDEEATSLSEALPYCKEVEKIDLKSNDIGAAGAHAIFEQAVQCPKLEVISMTKNPLGDDASQSIAPHLPKLVALKTLWLNECDIGDDGIAAFMRELPNCRGLRNFYVFDNAITDDGAKEIIDVLPQCPFLVQFGIGGNNINEETISLLQKSWEVCQRVNGHQIYVR